jgi:hypothetical protein
MEWLVRALDSGQRRPHHVARRRHRWRRHLAGLHMLCTMRYYQLMSELALIYQWPLRPSHVPLIGLMLETVVTVALKLQRQWHSRPIAGHLLPKAR